MAKQRLSQLWCRYRLWIGGALMVLSLLPWLLVAVVPFFSLSGGVTAGVIGALIFSAEVIFVLAVLVLGKDAYDRLRARLSLRSSSQPSPGDENRIP